MAMRIIIALAAAGALAACQEPLTNENQNNASTSIDPGQPAAVTPGISGAEAEGIAEEQRRAAQTTNGAAPK